MKNKLFAFVLIIAIVFTSFPVFVITSSAAEIIQTEAQITVEQVYAKRNMTVEVNVLIKDNPGILSMTLKVNYDETRLRLVGVESGGAMSYLDFTVPKDLGSGCTLPWDAESINPDDIKTKSGTLAVLTFEVLDTANENDFLAIDVVPFGTIQNNGLNSLLIDFVPGHIRVLNYIPGDVNSDGIINATDVSYLRRWIAGGYYNVVIDEAAADVNGDGIINTTDTVYIRRYIAGGYGITLLPSTFVCVHEIEYKAAVAATCTEAGNSEYWHCTKCGKYFADADGNKEISLEDTVVTGGAHSLEVISAVAATCTEAGNSEYWHCTKCGKYFADADGNNEITIESTVVNPKGHTVVIDAAVSPTYDSTGLTEGSHCSVCNTVLKAQEIVDKLEPTYHSITYKDTKGAEISADKMRYSEHEGLLDMPEISADGYKFKGWYSTSEYIEGTKVDHIPEGSKENYVLYARWNPIKYTITYNDSGVHENVESYTIEDRIVLKTPQWSGLQFVNWTDEDGMVVSIIEKGTTGNIILTANWKSYRNNLVPAKDSKLISAYREDKGLYYFAYKLGTIENVVVSSIVAPYPKTTNAVHDLKLEKTINITESSMQSVAEMISKSTTNTTSHIETQESGSQHTSMRSLSNTLEVGGKGGVEGLWEISVKDSFTASGTWGDITFENKGSSDTTENSVQFEESNSRTSTLSYSKEMSMSEARTISITGDMPNGYYEYVYTTDVVVYTIIIYSPSKEGYYIGTYSALGDLAATLMYYRQSTDKYDATCDEFSYDNVSKDLKNAIADIIESSYYVEYAANGGKGTMKSSLHIVGEKSNLSSNGFNRDGYDFKGWATSPDGEVVYKDKAEVKDIAEKGKIITLYAVWDVNPYEIGKYVANQTTVSDTNGKRTFEVYLNSVPRFCNGEVITVIYLTKEFQKDEITDPPVTTDLANETYIVGDASITYKKGYMCFPAIAEGSSRTIHLKDFNFESDSGAGAINNYSSEHESFGACVGGDITIEVIGNCSINTSIAGSTAIQLATQNITFKGSDTLTVKGGKGADATVAGTNGGNGGTGIIAGNITVDMTGTLNVYGGNGGGGADGTNGTDGTGENGGRGGDGGAGNYAVHSESQIVVKNGTVNLHGGASGSSGRGGNGGKGATGAKGTAYTNGKLSGTGGDGGKGGDGGDSGNVMLGSFATNCGYIIPDNSTATVYCEIGKTGNAGEPGKGNEGGNGGKGWWLNSPDGHKGADGSDGSYGRVLYDVTTAGVYNNADNGNVTHSVENGMLKITVSGEAAPGLGGFVQSTSSAPYKVFYHTIVAKVPVGYKLEHASNAIGDGAHFEWMTSNSGTGEFETYVYRTTCGSTGTFNDFGYVYLYADDYTTVSYPVEWYVSYANITE